MHRHFEDDLDQLRTHIIRMGSLVDEQVEDATRALIEGNEALAQLVVDREDKVDSFDVRIDEACLEIFARAQPVAVDLRLIMSALKINNELERIGDLAVNIAERVPALAKHRALLEKIHLFEMARAAQAMVQKTIDSFVNNDPALARMVIETDDKVDSLDKDLFTAIIREMKENPALVEPAAHVIALLRHIERLADHATNIAEDVVFLVEAKIIKHHNDEQK